MLPLQLSNIQSDAKSRIYCCVLAKSNIIHARDNDRISITIPLLIHMLCLARSVVTYTGHLAQFVTISLSVRTRAANSNLNSKELDHFAKLELEKIFFLNSNLNSH